MSERVGAIYAVRNDRMGGRLGAMLNAKRIADDYGAEFRFTWSNHENVSPELQHPERLFSKAFMTRHHEHRRSFGELQQQVPKIETIDRQTNRDNFKIQLNSGDDFQINEAMRTVALPWENLDEVSRRLAETLDTIDFAAPVKRAMDAIRSRLGESTLVAYHLRRGDIIDPNARASNTLWPSKYVPRVYYETHMTRVLDEDPDARIVVFSDAEHELEAFAEMSDRVITASSLLTDKNLDPLQRDFLELYTMSRCARIIAPGASAFSSVAAILGNGKIVDITKDLSAEENSQALDEMTHRLEFFPEMFAGPQDLGQNFPHLIEYHRQSGTAETACRVLQRHLDDGFSLPYIYDLLAQEYFFAGDTGNALNLIEILKTRPILTDLSNSPSYAWVGLLALADGQIEKALQLAHVSHWLQPILPVSRILTSSLTATGLLDRNNHYPVPEQVIIPRYTMMPHFREIADRISPTIASLTGGDPSVSALYTIPFELDIRDWIPLQSLRLPPQFWNFAKLEKLIEHFQQSYRASLSDPAVQSMLGQLHCQAKDHATGIPLIQNAYEQNPEDAFLNLRLARVRMQQSQYVDALQLYEQASVLSDGQVCFRAEQGLAKIELGDKDGAIEIFRELATIDHQIVEVLILTADVLRRDRKYRKEALSVAQKASDLVPGGTRTTQILRKVLEQLNKKKEAEALKQRFQSWKRNPGKFSSRITKIGG